MSFLRYKPLIGICVACAIAGAAVVSEAEKDEAWVAKRRSYWAFRQPVRPEPPNIPGARVQTPIDAFILEALGAKGLRPSAPAGRAQLLRRVTLDLTGLPPSVEEIKAFLDDRSRAAYEKVVDRLLSSPHYGERWALRWLDVARYADTNGFEVDAYRPDAWRYRDYVVKAFNQDKPYDRFLQEQLAGDELWPGNEEALIATGFNRLGPIHLVSGVQDEELNRQERLTEMASSIGPVFLGMTVGCARCHNHKFDPILQSDYYRIQAIFAGTEFKDIPIAPAAEIKAFEEAKKAHEERLKPIKDRIAALEKPYRDELRAKKVALLAPGLKAVLEVAADKHTPEQKKLAKDAKAQTDLTWDEVLAALPPDILAARGPLRKQLIDVQDTEPLPPPGAFAVVNVEGAPLPTHVLKVGDYKHRLGEVRPGFLKVLAPDYGVVPEAAHGRRSALARWLASPDHPLTARVMVNRIWQFRMGTGIVATPNDFGALGQRPSNEKLLDWLATEFVRNKWSVKAMDRLKVLSNVYRQSTSSNAVNAKIDPTNRLYWRMNQRRLEGEAIRDNVLAVSGTFNPKLGGKPILVPIEKEVYDLIFTEGEPDNLWRTTPDPFEHNRRSLYLLNRRSIRLPMLANFDQPDTMTSCPVRPTSTHALQSLSLFNSDFMHQQSAAFAARLVREAGPDRAKQIRHAFSLALSRAPRPAELALAQAFLRKGPLADFCLTLLNRNEFVYVP